MCNDIASLYDPILRAIIDTLNKDKIARRKSGASRAYGCAFLSRKSKCQATRLERKVALI